jgi:hypothetical protein
LVIASSPAGLGAFPTPTSSTTVSSITTVPLAGLVSIVMGRLGLRVRGQFVP